MDSLTEWLGLAEKLGIGATFVLGIVLIFLWKAWRSDQDYLRQRDKETLTVIANLTAMLDKQANNDTANIVRILDSISNIAKDLERHDKQESTLIREVLEKIEHIYIKLL